MFISIVHIAFIDVLLYHTKEVNYMLPNSYMSQISDDTYLSQINIVGTHDSCANNVEYTSIARCQNMSVINQLEKGIRLFDIRLSYSNGRYPLVHYLADCYVYRGSKYKLYFEYIFSILKRFLEKHPEETILLSVKKDRGILRDTFAKYFIDRFIKDNEESWFLENRIPKLKEVRGKIVLLRRFYCPERYLKRNNLTSLGIDLSVWENQKTKEPFPFSQTNINESDSAIIQDSYNIEMHDKWYTEIEPFLDISYPTKNKIFLNWLNTSGGGKTPKENSNFINSKLENLLRTKSNIKGWFFIDFPTEKIIDCIIKSNFQKEEM